MLLKNFMSLLMLIALGVGGLGAWAEGDDETPSCDAGKASEKAHDPCYESTLKKCQEGAKDAGTALCKIKAGGSVEEINAAKAKLEAMSAQLKAASGKCQNLLKECEEKCSNNESGKAACKKQISEIQDLFSTNSDMAAQNASGFGKTSDAMSGSKDTKSNDAKTGKSDMSGITSMLGPAAAIGAAMLANQKKDESEDDSSLYTGAVQKNGTVLCDRADSGIYATCDSYLQAACLQSIQAGSFANSTTCSNFSQRFCTGGDGTAATTTTATTTTLYNASTTSTATPSTMPEVGAQGAGVNTTFCKAAIAYNYCAGGGHNQCPSCLGLGNIVSVTCQANPAACVAQSSDATINQARSSCPDDPMFSTAAPAIAGTATTNGTLGLGGITTTAPNPTVITTNTGIVTSLPQSATAPASASSSTTGRSVSSTLQPSSALQPSSVNNVGPASDIGSEYGPSLSNITGTTIKNRCQNDQLNCR